MAVVISATQMTMPSAGGVDFSATAGGGATSSLLDDYEEGTWTPVVSGETNCSAVTFNRNAYTKVGNVTTIFISVSYTITVTATITYFVFTLPYNMADATDPGTGTMTTSVRGGSVERVSISDATGANATQLVLRQEAAAVGGTGTAVCQFSLAYKSA